MTNTQRTLGWLRDRGYTVGMVERWIAKPGVPGGGFRQDYLGIIDIIALGADGVIGVQSCGTSFSEHKEKLTVTNADMTRAWLSTPGTTLLLVGWSKRKRRLAAGGWSKASFWTPREEAITLAMIDG
jgi:hypothetical protein